MHVIFSALISGLSAGTAAVCVTIAIEKLGGRLGGVISSSPSTIIPFSVSIALTTSVDNVTRTLFTTPLSLLINGLFLLYWREIPALNLYKMNLSSSALYIQLIFMIITSLFFWFCLSLISLLFLQTIDHNRILPIQITGIVSILTALTLGLAAVLLKPLPAPSGTNPVSLPMYIARGIFPAIAIFCAVLISNVSSVASGLLSGFPAIFITSMVGVWLSQGMSVTTGAAGPMMLGSLSVSLYAMLFAVGIRNFGSELKGVVLSGVGSYVIAIGGVSVPVYFLLDYLRKRSAKQRGAEEEERKRREEEEKEEANIENEL